MRAGSRRIKVHVDTRLGHPACALRNVHGAFVLISNCSDDAPLMEEEAAHLHRERGLPHERARRAIEGDERASEGENERRLG